MALDLSTEEKQQLQADVLWDDTSTNPNLTASGIPSKNKAYKTTNKRTIGAVNELKDGIDNINVSVNTNLKDFITVIGDYNLNPQYLTDLKEIAPTILEAIKALHEEIKLLKQGNGSSTCNGEEMKIFSIEVVYNESNEYELPHQNIPEKADFELTINGLEALEGSDYRVDRESGILYWENSAAYELAEGDRIVAQYFISKTTLEKG